MKYLIGVVALSAALAVGTTAHAQDYNLSVGGATTHNVNSSFDLTVDLDSSLGTDIAGWSFGLCHDATFFDIVDTVDGSTTSTVKNGAAADFNQVNVIPGEGFTVGVVICFTGCAVLAPTANAELNVVSYTAGGTEGSGDVAFCDTLGVPAVATVVVVGGASIVPGQAGATVEVVAPPPPGFDYIAPTLSANFDGTAGTGSFSAAFSIAEDPTSPGFPNDTQGFSMGVAHDSAILAVAGGPTPTLPFSPDFEGPNVLVDGWTIGVVYSFTGANVLAFDGATPVISVDYDISGLAGSGPVSTPLSWSNGLGTPPVDNVVVVGGQSLDASFIDGSVDLIPVTDTPFVRGDCNADEKVNIADGVWILSFLFTGGPAGTCEEACDADDNGSLDMLDGIYVITYHILSGAAPAAPFPECGTDAGAPCDAHVCP